MRTHVRQQEMLEDAYAVAQGTGTANPGPKGGRERSRSNDRRWKRIAFPEQYERDEQDDDAEVTPDG